MKLQDSAYGPMILGLYLLSTASVYAAELRTRLTYVDVEQSADLVRVGTGEKERRFPLGASPEVTLRPGESLQVRVVDGNPILFKYSLSDPVKTPTQNFENAKKFAEAIKKLLGELSPENDQADATVKIRKSGQRDSELPNFRVGEVKTAPFLLAMQGVLRFPEDAAEIIDSTLPSGSGSQDADLTTEKHTDRVKSLKSDAETVIDGLAKLSAANLGLALPGGTIRFCPDADCRTEIPLPSREDLKKAMSAVDRQNGANVYELIFDVFYGNDDVEGIANAAVDFAVAFLAIPETSIVGSPIAYDRANITSVELKVTENNKFDELLSKRALRYKLEKQGSHKIIIKPRERFSLSISAGAIYSFVKDPQFSVKEDSDGNLTVARTSNDVNEFGGAVALDITRSEWAEYGVVPFFQVGVSPENSNLAFLAGVGIKAFDQFTLSAGYIYQQVDELSGGLSVGDTLTSADDLNTDDKFEGDLYIMLGVNLLK